MSGGVFDTRRAIASSPDATYSAPSDGPIAVLYVLSVIQSSSTKSVLVACATGAGVRGAGVRMTGVRGVEGLGSVGAATGLLEIGSASRISGIGNSKSAL